MSAVVSRTAVDSAIAGMMHARDPIESLARLLILLKWCRQNPKPAWPGTQLRKAILSCARYEISRIEQELFPTSLFTETETPHETPT
jgi:hypothetical protein